MIIALSTFSSYGIVINDLGVDGHTFLVEEDNMSDVIQKKLHEAQRNGELTRHQENLKLDFLKSIKNPRGNPLPKAKERKIIYIDPTVRLQEDIKGHNGKTLFKKGTTINPFDYVSMTKPLIFIDGKDQKQIDFAIGETQKNHNIKIILVDGHPFDLMTSYKIPIYFDQFGRLIKKLGMTHVPTQVTQENKKLKLEHIPCS